MPPRVKFILYFILRLQILYYIYPSPQYLNHASVIEDRSRDGLVWFRLCYDLGWCPLPLPIGLYGLKGEKWR